MIIKTTEVLKEFLSVNGSVDIDTTKPYLLKAERNFLKPVIGAAQLTIFDAEVTDPIIQEAQKLAQEAVANFGYYLGLPILAVQITNSGIMVVDNENTKTATDKQFKELQRSFKSSAHEALDELLEYMEDNAAKFIPWTESNNYTVYNGLLVKDTKTFNNFFYIFNSRQTFIALRSNLKVCEDQFIKGSIGKELLEALKTKQLKPERQEVKELLQQSIVAFAVMKTVYNGMFILDAKGIHMRFDALPYESTVTNINLKVSDLLVHTKKTKQIEGEEYLKAALKIIKKNADEFTEYTPLDTRSQDVKITNTPSIVAV